MKSFFLSFCLIFLILGYSCQQEKADQVKQGEPASTQKKLKAKLALQDIEAKVFQAALKAQNDVLDIERLCDESEGYRSNEWTGLNDCSWAIEQQLLAQNSEKAKREGNQLLLQLENKQWLSIDHLPEAVYYQFNGWIKRMNCFLVLINKVDECPTFWLIDRKDGNKQEIAGIPYFSTDGSLAFVSSTSSDSAAICNNQLELWQYLDGKLYRQSVLPSQNRIIDKLIWKGNKEALVQQSSFNADQTTAYYARVEL